MYLTALQICYTKVNQVTLCTTKLNEGFAMLIPKVLIHGSIRPLPEAFVSSIRLRFRLSMELWAADSVCSSRANAKFVEPNALATTWRHVASLQEFKQQMRDHALMLALSINMFTRTFH